MNIKLYSLIAALVLAVMLSGCEINPEGRLGVGMTAPMIKTKTLADVNGDFSRVTTYRQPDARMYQYSLDDALKMDKLIVLEFATPGHCTVCDKQLNMMKAMMDKYEDDVLFLHMDQYQNTGAFISFKVQGDPWTFIIDRHNIVQFKRAGRMLYGELDIALKELLEKQG